MRLFLFAALGYGFSVFAAVTIMFIFYSNLSHDFWYDFQGTMIIYCFTLILAGLGGLPGFMFALIIQKINKISASFYWVLCGFLAVSLANLLFAFLLMPFTPTLDMSIFVYTTSGGVLTGYIYSWFDQQTNFRQIDIEGMFNA